MVAILTEVRYNFNVFICISLIAKDSGQLFLYFCLFGKLYFLFENCLFNQSVSLLIGWFILVIRFLSSLYTVDINPPLDVQLVTLAPFCRWPLQSGNRLLCCPDSFDLTQVNVSYFPHHWSSFLKVLAPSSPWFPPAEFQVSHWGGYSGFSVTFIAEAVSCRSMHLLVPM